MVTLMGMLWPPFSKTTLIDKETLFFPESATLDLWEHSAPSGTCSYLQHSCWICSAACEASLDLAGPPLLPAVELKRELTICLQSLVVKSSMGLVWRYVVYSWTTFMVNMPYWSTHCNMNSSSQPWCLQEKKSQISHLIVFGCVWGTLGL